MAVSKRDCKAFSFARSLFTKPKAESTVLSASVAFLKLVISKSATLFSVELSVFAKAEPEAA